MSLSPLQLICFGPPTATVEGRAAPPEVLWRKHLALLVYLALSPNRTRAREHLLGLLWAERPDSRARHALNEAVLRLRRALGSGRLRSEGDALALDGAGLEVDALRFDALADGDPAAALALARGDFLEGFALEGAPAFEDWAGAQRRRYRARTAAALVLSGERELDEGRWGRAAEAARRALVLEPFSEPAARLLVQALALGGDAGGALAAYKEFAARLDQELGEGPPAALATLASRLRRDGGAAGPPAGPDPDREPPLVGRAAEHARAFGEVSAALAGTPRLVLITGAPGMGRSRLLAECTRRVTLGGGRTAFARPLEHDVDARWSALRLLVRGGVAELPGLVGARPDALAVLAGLAPELAERFPAREPRDTADVASALAAVLATAAVEAPVAVAVDDAHWADGPSLAALGGALEQLRDAPVVLLLTAVEPAPPDARELSRLSTAVGRRLAGASVRLAALSTPDVEALVGELAPWCVDPGHRDRLTRRLVAESGGSPLFTVTLLRGLARATQLQRALSAWPEPRGTFDNPIPFSLPDVVRLTVTAAVAELDLAARGVLAAAAIGYQVLDVDLVAAVSGRSGDEVDRALPELERRHLIAFDGQRYAFTAMLVAEVVRSECMTGGERRALRERGVAALAGRTDLESLVLRADLLARVRPGAEAFAAALDAAEAALAGGAARMARRAAAAAERACRGAPVDAARLDAVRARLG